ncbi:aminotransferase class I/II-fold pyridoxal phosphate-dependent enzyme [Corynebacterium poyangense]|uniref:Aminotransferase class I/II-fold pyridoxal phosphate-dependent enzyme n=1 Tax=Corynebacterium poyangense TaxID=2684405 RepID=A0A7H0SLI5_9CORY|nr:aminotransferase class I/II-fold pyridoxal phosphate-dependent enzyme [Corynebacterium poyangense]QNQ89410.1 aminotransferase class I/II-fold pyridoxal phosphate-dependent enzyme [Corynebacterium poyangense]
MSLRDLTPEQLKDLAADVRSHYQELKAKNLNLDLTRGKPSSEQLDFAQSLLSLPGEDDYLAADGTDCRNYGNLKGITDIRSLWAELLGVPVELVYAQDSSSLNIMFDLISWSFLFGNNDSTRPWKDEEKVRWICPVPGYDRHFTITETLGVEMVTVPMTKDGPDMEAVRELALDPQVKGMWCVPVFGNPTGITFSEQVCRELASMETGAEDFRIVWDNAYAVHTLTDTFPPIYNVIRMAEEAGNPNRFWCMSSTSKITFAGAGVAFFASSPENLAWYSSLAGVRGIGPNKINQLAHARYFGSADGVRAVMLKHAGSLAPKFERVLQILDDRLGEYEFATWTKPEGGYFISLDVLDGTAARTVQLAKDAGIALTGAGSSFPLHHDPHDRNIRLAPSLPPEEEIATAMDGVATCALLAAVEKLGA